MKDKTKQIFCIALMAYLALSVLLQIYYFFANIISAATNYYYTFSVTNAFIYFFTGLSFLTLLAFVAAAAFEQFGKFKNTLKKIWFLPGIFRAISLLISHIASYASLRYSSGWTVVNTVLSNFLGLLTTAAYIVAFMMFFPKLLTEQTEPLFKMKQRAPAAPKSYPGYPQQNPYQQGGYQQPAGYPQQNPYQQPAAAPQQNPYQQGGYQQPAAYPQQNPYQQGGYQQPGPDGAR